MVKWKNIYKGFIIFWGIFLVISIILTWITVEKLLEIKQNFELLPQIGFMVITIALAMLGIFVNSLMQEEKRREKIIEHKAKQQQILRSLEALKLEIKIASKGHIKELSKQRIPSYFIPKINSFFYISQLDTNINNRETFALKQILIKLDNKIENINRLVELGQNAYTLGHQSSKKYLLRELKENTYYADLEKLLSLLDELWIKLEGHM